MWFKKKLVTKPVLVLIMLDCTKRKFDEFKEKMDRKRRTKLPQVTMESEEISQLNTDIRGLKIVLPELSARNLITKHSTVLGVSYIMDATTDFTGVILPPAREADRGELDNGNPLDGSRTPWHLRATNSKDTREESGVNVYVMDTGINKTHQEFQGLNFGEMSEGHFVADGGLRGIEDSDGHGTQMASMVVGRNVGVAKRATLIPVRFYSGQPKRKGETTITASGLNVFRALLWILAHVNKNNKRGKAIVNLSQGFGRYYSISPVMHRPTTPTSNAAPTEPGLSAPSEDEINRSDPWYHFLPIFAKNNIVVVSAAGNESYKHTGDPKHEHDEYLKTSPLCFAHTQPDNIIVIGGSNKNGQEWGRSNQYHSIIDAYAPAEIDQVPCFQNNHNYVSAEGTSLSTAIASGIIATYLSTAPKFEEGKAGATVKEHIRRVCQKGQSSSGNSRKVSILKAVSSE